MVHIPATGRPVADQWEVNSFIMHLLKNRYNQKNEMPSKASMAPPAL